MTDTIKNPLVIATDTLKAALACASTEQSRYYLNGVYVDPMGYIVSTDGHRMFIAKYELTPGIGFDGFIIPSTVLKRVLTGNKQVVIELTNGHIDRQRYEPIDGTYPDWRRVVPGMDPSNVAAQFNPAYVGDMGKIAKLLGSKSGSAVIHHNGDGPAGVTFGGREDCFAVIMPLRPAKDAPTWADLRGIID